MEKHIIQFFKFLEDKGEKRTPLRLKLLDPQTFGEPTKEDLKVNGDLSLSGTSIKELPEGLKVGGNLRLAACTSLKELPQDLEVGGNLNLNGCRSLEKLPKGLKAGRGLWLNGCRSLKELPEGLQVGGVLSLSNCISLKKLPQGLKVDGNLSLIDTPIAEKYSEEEIRKIVKDRGGYILGKIFM